MYKGGTFDIERRQVGSGHWQITETHVHIGGHALFFKSIGTQEDEVKTDWKPSPDETLIEAARTLGAHQ
jgi:predicted metalloprotease with PDZ domain